MEFSQENKKLKMDMELCYIILMHIIKENGDKIKNMGKDYL